MNSSKRIGIIGNGFVGKATQLFQCERISVKIYDIDPEKCVPLGTTLNDLVMGCDIIFICVPTPSKESGECYTGIVEKCIQSIRLELSNSTVRVSEPFIVVRSTVPPGFCKKWNVYHMPEFLTERNWKKDFFETKHWIVGCPDTCTTIDRFSRYIVDLFQTAKREGCIAHDNVELTHTNYSEMVKYGRNAFLAVKLSFCNEMYAYCKALDIDYAEFRRQFILDRRISPNHTSVPGPDGKLGYGGTCLPKDIASFAHEMEQAGLTPYVLNASIDRNTRIDRPEQEWTKDEGRSVISSLREK
jgi:UDPglucose 6-dehydrogenase